MQPYIVRAVEADRDARLVRFAVQAPHPFTLDAAAQAIGLPLPLPRKAQNELAALLSPGSAGQSGGWWSGKDAVKRVAYPPRGSGPMLRPRPMYTYAPIFCSSSNGIAV